jgi:hypothetical protein
LPSSKSTLLTFRREKFISAVRAACAASIMSTICCGRRAVSPGHEYARRWRSFGGFGISSGLWMASARTAGAARRNFPSGRDVGSSTFVHAFVQLREAAETSSGAEPSQRVPVYKIVPSGIKCRLGQMSSDLWGDRQIGPRVRGGSPSRPANTTAFVAPAKRDRAHPAE